MKKINDVDTTNKAILEHLEEVKEDLNVSLLILNYIDLSYFLRVKLVTLKADITKTQKVLYVVSPVIDKSFDFS